MRMAGNVQKKHWYCPSILTVFLFLLACDRSGSANGQARSARTTRRDSMGVEPSSVRSVAMHVRPALVENSAAVMSARQPGVIFTINDSGNDPILFAFDTSGSDRGAWRVNGASNVDWESAALGPCSGAAHPSGSCIYIGDTGDNQARHPSRAIYRVNEPDANRATGSVSADRLTYVYEDGPHDVEAMYVARNGDILLITKRPLLDQTRRPRPALVYRMPASAWGESKRVVAQLVDSLPIVPGSAPLREVTDASLSPDARHLAVRTYTQVFIFAADPASGRILASAPPAICNIVSLGERQGEGITWVNAAGRLAFTSEGRSAPLYMANCPLPSEPR